MNVLFVCTGNLCRSPMAEAMLRRALHDRGCGGVEVASAGTWAVEGSPATAEAQRAVERRGMDLEGHRSRPLDHRLVERADLIVAMTAVHEREILELAPGAAPKVRLLKELPELVTVAGAGGHRRLGLDALLRSPRPDRRRRLDVDDPIGLPASAYERCARELEEGVRAVADGLCGRPRRAPQPW